MNKQRMKKMKARNKYVEESFTESKKGLAQYFSENTDEYKNLLKSLICQGLIKMMEGEVHLSCRKSDEDLINEVLEDAMAMYREKMAAEVKMLKGREPPVSIIINEKAYLPEYDEENINDKTASCIGGIKMSARKNRIVCSNTLDDRLELCYQEFIPHIKKILFPNSQI